MQKNLGNSDSKNSESNSFIRNKNYKKNFNTSGNKSVGSSSIKAQNTLNNSSNSIQTPILNKLISSKYKKNNYKFIIDDCFDSSKLDSNVWRISPEDSTGGFNNTLQAYNGNKTNNIRTGNGLTLTAKSQWYVQPAGFKGNEPAPDPTKRVARPYTSGRIDTLGKISVDLGKEGFIEVKLGSPSLYANGTWPAIWLYAENASASYGGWSASGEIDIMEIWRYPTSVESIIDPTFQNYPQFNFWFGGSFPDNTILSPGTIAPKYIDYVIKFEWDGTGNFIWSLNGVKCFIITPKDALLRTNDSENSPLVSFNSIYGSNYFSFGNLTISNQPYQGVYVGYYDPPTDSVITTNPSPAPYTSLNPMYLIIELQVGGNPFTIIAPDNTDVFNAGETTDLSSVQNGVLSNYEAQQLGLPQRPQAYFTDNQKWKVYYVKYAQVK